MTPRVNMKPELVQWAIKRTQANSGKLRERFPKLDD